MKPTFLILMLVTTASFGSTLRLPATTDSASVQAKLKNLLFQKLEAEGPQTEEYAAKLTGSYRQVTLEDKASKIVCSEGQAGMLAVQQFQCDITKFDGSSDEVASLRLEQTMDAASVQSTVKGVLYQQLEEMGPVTAPYEASLTGSYSEVTLEDHGSRVVCREHSAGMLTVQTFGCDFETK